MCNSKSRNRRVAKISCHKVTSGTQQNQHLTKTVVKTSQNLGTILWHVPNNYHCNERGRLFTAVSRTQLYQLFLRARTALKSANYKQLCLKCQRKQQNSKKSTTNGVGNFISVVSSSDFFSCLRQVNIYNCVY